MLGERCAEAAPVSPKPVALDLWFAGKVTEGEDAGTWRLVPRGSIQGVPEFTASRPGKFGRNPKGGELLDGLHSLELPLQKRAPLRIEKMCFCRGIQDFGRYAPIADGQAAFEAGSAGRDGEPPGVDGERIIAAGEQRHGGQAAGTPGPQHRRGVRSHRPRDSVAAQRSDRAPGLGGRRLQRVGRAAASDAAARGRGRLGAVHPASRAGRALQVRAARALGRIAAA